jgi:hypothetical protein
MAKGASLSSGVLAHQTLSGRSLGSLGHYSMDWNKADEGEVSSALTWAPSTAVGPSQLGTKMHIAKLALLEADRTAEVTPMSLLYFSRLVSWIFLSLLSPFFCMSKHLYPLVPEVLVEFYSGRSSKNIVRHTLISLSIRKLPSTKHRHSLLD